MDRSVSRLVSKFFWPLKTLNHMGAGVHHHLKIRYVKEPSSVDVVLKILFTNLSMLLVMNSCDGCTSGTKVISYIKQG